VNLREAALGWMQAQGFFAQDGFALTRANIHFSQTREEKLSRIAALSCQIFVDDLVEVLGDPGFPTGVERILFARNVAAPCRRTGWLVCASWDEIERAVFG